MKGGAAAPGLRSALPPRLVCARCCVAVFGQVVEVGGEAHDVAARLDMAGHRSDVRALAMSSDDALLASGSNAALKVRAWLGFGWRSSGPGLEGRRAAPKARSRCCGRMAARDEGEVSRQ